MKRELVTLQKEGKLVIVVINNPPLNLLDEKLMRELEDATDEIRDDAAIDVVVIKSGIEKSFVAGADISQFSVLDAAEAEKFARSGQAVFSKIGNLEQPVIACIHGYALGGGCELALAADIRIAAENAVLGLPETGLGIIPGYGGTQRLPRLVGTARAMRLICTGEPVDAATALRLGLVDECVPAGEEETFARKLAGKMLGRGPLALRAAKKAVYHSRETSLHEGLQLEAELFANLCRSQDQKEGAAAFLEKRKPLFAGH